MSRKLLAQLRMRWIRPGRYLRGSPEDDPEAWDNEKPQHDVVLTHGFWLSDAPVTQRVWVAVMGDNPSGFEGAERPVERVSWEDCQRFCARLARMSPGLHPRLPTEAEWEYAARAGTTTSRYGALDDAAWHVDNSDERTHPVRQKQPNAWGLYDMLGNVWEWCRDRGYSDEPYSAEARAHVDPLGNRGPERVVRGGAWFNGPRVVRGACRGANDPGSRFDNLGFRLAGGEPRSSVGAEGGGARSPGLAGDEGGSQGGGPTGPEPEVG